MHINANLGINENHILSTEMEEIRSIHSYHLLNI